MALCRFKYTSIFEIDTETGKSRNLQSYTQRLGTDVKLKKEKPKPKVVQTLKTETTETLEL